MREIASQRGALASLLTVAAVVAVSSAPARGASSAAVPSCQTAGLVAWLDTNANGTAGSLIYDLNFTNLSGHTCSLAGYPGVSAVGLTGRQLGSAGTRDTNFRTKTVTLKNTATASALLRITEAGNFPASRCHQTTAAGLRVYPPNQKASKTIPFPFAACARSGPTYLGVEAVRP